MFALFHRRADFRGDRGGHGDYRGSSWSSQTIERTTTADSCRHPPNVSGSGALDAGEVHRAPTRRAGSRAVEGSRAGSRDARSVASGHSRSVERGRGDFLAMDRRAPDADSQRMVDREPGTPTVLRHGGVGACRPTELGRRESSIRWRRWRRTDDRCRARGCDEGNVWRPHRELRERTSAGPRRGA